MWIALVRDIPPYQMVLSRTISPDSYTLSVDEYGNKYAEFDFSDHPAGTTVQVNIEYEVVINELAYDRSFCKGDLPDEFTQPEFHIESLNPQIVALTKNLSRGKNTVCDQVRAFYDYAGDELFTATTTMLGEHRLPSARWAQIVLSMLLWLLRSAKQVKSRRDTSRDCYI